MSSSSAFTNPLLRGTTSQHPRSATLAHSSLAHPDLRPWIAVSIPGRAPLDLHKIQTLLPPAHRPQTLPPPGHHFATSRAKATRLAITPDPCSLHPLKSKPTSATRLWARPPARSFRKNCVAPTSPSSGLLDFKQSIRTPKRARHRRNFHSLRLPEISTARTCLPGRAADIAAALKTEPRSATRNRFDHPNVTRPLSPLPTSSSHRHATENVSSTTASTTRKNRPHHRTRTPIASTPHPTTSPCAFRLLAGRPESDAQLVARCGFPTFPRSGLGP